MKRISMLGVFFGLALTLSACGKENISKADEEVELAAFSNSGYTAILETENGFYYNGGYIDDSDILYNGIENGWYPAEKDTMMLRYYDKATKTSVMLCNKPECDHTNPETCVAIHKNLRVMNTLLYDGSLYVYGVEKDGVILRFALYRVALDGSSIDRVGVAFETENTLEEGYEIIRDVSYPFDEQMCAVIYKGDAYLPYRVQIGTASRGFKGAGIVRMNLKDGTTKEIFSSETKQGEIPCEIKAVGDYIYFKGQSYNQGTAFYRYMISEDRMAPYEVDIRTEEEKEQLKKRGLDPDMPAYPVYDIVDGDKLIRVKRTRKKGEEKGRFFLIISSAVDSSELENLELPFDTEDVYWYCEHLLYDNKFFLRAGDHLYIISLADDETHGQVLTEIYEPENDCLENYDRSICVNFKVKDGKIYCVVRPAEASEEMSSEDERYFECTLYSCDLAEALAGNVTWEKEFSFDKCR